MTKKVLTPEENRKEMIEILKDLDTYIEIENSELGEMWSRLSEMWQRSTFMSEVFVRALEREIRRHYKDLKENTYIEEERVTFEPQIVKRLEWYT